MAEDINFLAGQSSLWVQPDGPNTKPLYLMCHGVGDLTEPMGDETLLYCPDPAEAGAYTVKNSFTGEPGVVTTTVVTDIRRTADYLESLGKCRFPLFIHKVCNGRRDVFTNYDRSFVLRFTRVSQRTLGNLASRTPGDENESTQTFDAAARFLSRIFNLMASRVTLAAVGDITGIAICGEDRCESACGAAEQKTDLIFVATKALAASAAAIAEVYMSENGGSFAATAADPFGAGEDIQGIVCFRVGRETTRVIVARGTTDAGNPAEISWSDDNGDIWNDVNVGSTNGEFVTNGHALAALSRYNIWLGTNLGNIYFSDDGGLTWTKQTAVPVSATPIQGISIYSPNTAFAVHSGGQVDKTNDGGETWSAATASGTAAARDIHAISPYFVWVVGTDGKFYSHDAGDSWATRDTVPTGAIEFLDEMTGIAAGSAASGVIYETINGGYDWSPLPTITNQGFLDAKILSPSLAYVSGVVSGGTGFLAKLQPVP